MSSALGSNYRWWPAELKRRVHYYAMNSMGFFVHAEAEGLALDLVLIDGNHDYEFAAFDIHAAARLLSPGGFIFIDNVSQVGPFLAATEFFAANPDWIDCGLHPLNPACEQAHDRRRTNVPDTDFFIFRSPRFRSVGAKPRTFGNVGWTGAPVSGVRLSLAGSQSAGTLRVQCILRAFSDTRTEELIGETAQTIEGGSAGVEVRLKAPIAAEGEFSRYQVETWLMWSGGNPLELSAPPEVL
jgi:hypothetical protein